MADEEMQKRLAEASERREREALSLLAFLLSLLSNIAVPLLVPWLLKSFSVLQQARHR